MSLAKRIPYRNQKIRDAANGEECTLNGPVCNYDKDTVVFCHLNEDFAGKGGSQKADDCAGFFGCSACHDLYDRRRSSSLSLWNECKDFYVLRAMTLTIRRLIDLEILK